MVLGAQVTSQPFSQFAAAKKYTNIVLPFEIVTITGKTVPVLNKHHTLNIEKSEGTALCL